MQGEVIPPLYLPGDSPWARQSRCANQHASSQPSHAWVWCAVVSENPFPKPCETQGQCCTWSSFYSWKERSHLSWFLWALWIQTFWQPSFTRRGEISSISHSRQSLWPFRKQTAAHFFSLYQHPPNYPLFYRGCCGCSSCDFLWDISSEIPNSSFPVYKGGRKILLTSHIAQGLKIPSFSAPLWQTASYSSGVRSSY